MNVLVLGASVMLGNAMVRVLSEQPGWQVFGTLRSDVMKDRFPAGIASRVISGVDAEDHDALGKVFSQVKPQVVINCVGLIKQLVEVEEPLMAIPINSLLPHRLAWLCQINQARLIHVSTDCVFSGSKGGYTEQDPADARDLYGKTKYLGEVHYPHTITLRTSIIGHEFASNHGLIEWFLSQQDRCYGFTNVIFSGLPTVVLSRLVRDTVIPRRDLSGLYHVASKPISKCDLLRTVAQVYGKTIDIFPEERPKIDRSLDGSRFSAATGFTAPDWFEMIRQMRAFG